MKVRTRLIAFGLTNLALASTRLVAQDGPLCGSSQNIRVKGVSIMATDEQSGRLELRGESFGQSGPERYRQGYLCEVTHRPSDRAGCEVDMGIGGSLAFGASLPRRELLGWRLRCDRQSQKVAGLGEIPFDSCGHRIDVPQVFNRPSGARHSPSKVHVRLATSSYDQTQRPSRS
jgi:hypothetical protein